MPRPALDLRVYLVTDTGLCGERGVPATVAAAVRGGVTIVQLRDPDADDASFVALGRALAAELAGTGVPLIVNDRVHLVAEIGADGAHVGQGDLDVATARALLGPDALLGLSVQVPEELEAALEAGLDAGLIDYLGVGPVWHQTTKAVPRPPLGVDGLAAVTAASPWPCVVIGGVDASRAAACKGAGAAGLAVVSAVCGQPDPELAARTLRTAWDEAPAPGAAHAGRVGA
ncbi:MAG: thiamine phosphate synthase [Kineosporiaceae bacterium]